MKALMIKKNKINLSNLILLVSSVNSFVWIQSEIKLNDYELNLSQSLGLFANKLFQKKDSVGFFFVISMQRVLFNFIEQPGNFHKIQDENFSSEEAEKKIDVS